MNKQRGFTLIELLIVVAILAMLVGMLLPALTRAKDLAKDAVCRGNLKSLWTPMRFYAEDHDGFLPPATDKFHGSWNRMLANYGKDNLGWTPPRSYTTKENFECPSYEYDISSRGCYGINFAMSGYDPRGQGEYVRGSWPNLAYMLEASLRPGKMYLVGDTSRWKPGGGHQLNFLRLSTTCTPRFRHLGHCNALFHDSHVEPLVEKDIPVQVRYYLPWFLSDEFYQ